MTLDKEQMWLVQMLSFAGIADIKVLRPVTVDLMPDPSRVARYFSAAQIIIQGKPMQFEFEIRETTLALAIEKYQAWLDRASAEAKDRIESDLIQNRLLGKAN